MKHNELSGDMPAIYRAGETRGRASSNTRFFSRPIDIRLLKEDVFQALRDLAAAETDKARIQELKTIIMSLENKFFSDEIDLSTNCFSLTFHEYSWLKRNPKNKWAEYIVHRYRFKHYPTSHIVSDFPVHVAIEPVSSCNLRCTMCFQVDESFSQNKRYMGMMDLDLFKKVVDEIAANGCKAVTLASRGEPTLHKDFDDMLSYLNQNNIYDIKINTNATLLTERLAHSILRNNVATVVFSVDAHEKESYERIRVGGNFEKVLENIKRFKFIRDTYYPDHTTQTRITGVAVDQNQDINQMEQFWSRYVDAVSIRRCIPRWDSYNAEPHNKNGLCNLMYERMYVWFNGDCSVCDYDYKGKINLGNVMHSSIREIWHGDSYTKLRSLLKDNQRHCVTPCDRCPFGVET